MIKYEIWTDNFEFRSCSKFSDWNEDKIFEEYLSLNSTDPTRVEVFDNLEDAEREFQKSYANYGRTNTCRNGAFHILYGDLAWLEEVDVDNCYNNETDEIEEDRMTMGIRETSVEPYTAAD